MKKRIAFLNSYVLPVPFPNPQYQDWPGLQALFSFLQHRFPHQQPMFFNGHQLFDEKHMKVMYAFSQVYKVQISRYYLGLIFQENENGQLVFQPELAPRVIPLHGMISPDVVTAIWETRSNPDAQEAIISAYREKTNPFNSNQDLNVPIVDGQPKRGYQLKYNTLLVFPGRGQKCFSYCTYCFRAPQLSRSALMFTDQNNVALLAHTLTLNPQVRDVLLTGGDPYTMSAKVLRRYFEVLATIPHIHSVRIGTSVLVYDPDKITSGKPFDQEKLDIIESFMRRTGKKVRIMTHFEHPAEITPATADAVARLRDIGAEVYSQAPFTLNLNVLLDNHGKIDIKRSAQLLRELWAKEQAIGVNPYYMFVTRDTGPKNFFTVPLITAYEIYMEAIRGLTGTEVKTAPIGPIMSTSLGKMQIIGKTKIHGDDVLVLKVLRGGHFLSREKDLMGLDEELPSWDGETILMQYDQETDWFDPSKVICENGRRILEQYEDYKHKKQAALDLAQEQTSTSDTAHPPFPDPSNAPHNSTQVPDIEEAIVLAK
jgi:L-lysine 2,3-aminomutase